MWAKPPGKENAGAKPPVRGIAKVTALGHVKAPNHALKSFAAEFGRLQSRSQQSASQAQQGGSVVEYLVTQVGVLQDAFVTMADSVIQELDTLRQESRRWQSDRQEWLSQILALRQEANDKLLQVDKAQALAAVELQSAKAEMQATVLRQAHQLELQSDTLSQQVTASRVEVQMLKNVVREMQTLTSQNFPNEVLRQRMLDKQQMEEAITQAVKDVVPRLVGEAVQQEAPAAVREQVGAVLRELVDQRTEPVRHEVDLALERMSSDVGSLGVELSTLAGAVEALSSRTKALEMSCSTTDTRLTSLESLDLPLLAGMQDRIDAMSAQQVRFAESMEGVVRALVEDAADLSRSYHKQASQVSAHQRHLEDTREALVRCATVFSALLGVPSPIPLAAMGAAGLGGQDMVGQGICRGGLGVGGVGAGVLSSPISMGSPAT